MKNLIRTVVVLMVVFLLSSCEYIPQYKFTSQIPNTLMEAKYGMYVENSMSELYMEFNLDATGAYTFEGYDSYEDILPQKGVCHITYSTYDVLEASGTMVFTDDSDPAVRVNATFVWSASADNGIESLQLSVAGRGIYTLVWLGTAEV